MGNLESGDGISPFVHRKKPSLLCDYVNPRNNSHFHRVMEFVDHVMVGKSPNCGLSLLFVYFSYFFIFFLFLFCFCFFHFIIVLIVFLFFSFFGQRPASGLMRLGLFF